jgi:hypothetical protein
LVDAVLAANQQLAQVQDEREETLDGFVWGRVVHSVFHLRTL